MYCSFTILTADRSFSIHFISLKILSIALIFEPAILHPEFFSNSVNSKNLWVVRDSAETSALRMFHGAKNSINFPLVVLKCEYSGNKAHV
jgi:hypothetical protein